MSTFLYDPPEVEELVDVLRSVCDWYTIGIKLNVPTGHLDTTGADVEEQKRKMFRAWVESMTERNETPTWAHILDVLKELRILKPVMDIERRYKPGESKPSSFPSDPPLPGIDSRPQLRHLQCILGTDSKKHRVIETVAPNWESVALQLGIRDAKIKQVKKEQSDMEEKCIKILQLWMDGGYRQPVTWRTLLDVLEDIHHSQLVINLQEYALKQR